MQIQCKSCGKAYQVDERRLTPEGVRVKCRSCGAILLLRLGKGHETAVKRAETHATAPDAPPLKREHPAAPVEPEWSALSEPELHEEFKPVTASGPVPSSEPVLPGYRFCIFCGGRLDQDLSPGTCPVCRICEVRKEAALSAPAAAVQGAAPGMSLFMKVLLFMILVLVALFAAFMGYQMALGSNLVLTSAPDFHGLIPAPDASPIFSGAMGF